MTGLCATCGMRHPVATVLRRVDDGSLAVACPVCSAVSVVQLIGVRPLDCGHTVEITNAPTGTPSRVRKARRRSACVVCAGLVEVGQQVGRVASGWAHVDCVNRARETNARPSPLTGRGLSEARSTGARPHPS